jgi:MscS family membrane protein
VNHEAWELLEAVWPTSVWLQALASIGLGSLGGLLMSVLSTALLSRIVARTNTDVDDQVVRHLRTPLTMSVFLLGLWQAMHLVVPPKPFPFFFRGTLLTLTVILWTRAFIRISHLTLDEVVKAQDRISWVDTRTVPLLKLVSGMVVWGGGAYFLFLAWNIDLTAWLASAGIAGIAIGFAAKDTLANLLSGVLIIADAPYQLGDMIVLDSGERGRVTKIGARSTRLVTLDDVEIIVPNAVISSTRVYNESGGIDRDMRITATVEAAYGSDVDQVRQVLLDVARDLPNLAATPPKVHFESFGASGLVFHLRVWANPRRRVEVLDAMNVAIYKQFNDAKIEIPFSKHDVYLYPQG